MTEYFYFPRLQPNVARQLLAEYTGVDIPALAEIVQSGSLLTPQAWWYPTAPVGQRIDVSILDAFRAAVIEAAQGHGYPALLSTKSLSRVAFDRDVVTRVSGLLPMLPVEAAQESVWSYLSLVVAPDVALWRWPNTRQKADYERILGHPRNVFRRLWWRAFALGTGADEVGAQIHEDEAVAILERTLIGGNRALARAIAETHISRFEDAPRRTDVMRDAMKRIRRLHAFISFHSLMEGEVRTVVNEAFDQAEASLLPGWRSSDNSEPRSDIAFTDRDLDMPSQTSEDRENAGPKSRR